MANQLLDPNTMILKHVLLAVAQSRSLPLYEAYLFKSCFRKAIYIHFNANPLIKWSNMEEDQDDADEDNEELNMCYLL